MNRKYCLIVFIVYMSYSDTQKVAKCCLYEKKIDVKKKEKKKGGHHSQGPVHTYLWFDLPFLIIKNLYIYLYIVRRNFLIVLVRTGFLNIMQYLKICEKNSLVVMYQPCICTIHVVIDLIYFIDWSRNCFVFYLLADKYTNRTPFSIQSCRSCYARLYLCQRPFYKILVKVRNSKINVLKNVLIIVNINKFKFLYKL